MVTHAFRAAWRARSLRCFAVIVADFLAVLGMVSRFRFRFARLAHVRLRTGKSMPYCRFAVKLYYGHAATVGNAAFHSSLLVRLHKK